ncbi:MAG: hypothetical protein GY913_35120 [Proteobacteria bacterium]|nr:hypothetical protein [Pseudomonadota bacterium]MCP4922162.1 hypothetical protein [Pseudomonadota bacterium]
MLLMLLSCGLPPDGLRATPEGDGPLVRVDWDAEPLPDIPYPNDLATRPDPSSPTGLRVNVPTAATIEAETEAREKLNELTGFGVYAPMSLGFEAPLDLDILWERHGGDERVGLERLDDDAVYVIDITPDSPDYGVAVELDLGEGRFPYDACDSTRYGVNDTRADQPSVVFETMDEDLNGNGVLDWGEDTDNDGHLDFPNVYPEGGEAREDLLGWYERESDTLIFRPVEPLREQTRYAVVITRRLVGEDHLPVQSPWPYINHTSQTQALEPLREVLPDMGLGMDDVAFTWSFTTGAITKDLVDLQLASVGEGPYSWLTEAIPIGIHSASQVWDEDGIEGYNLPTQEIMDALVDLDQFDPDDAQLLLSNYEHFSDRVVGGTFTTPNLLVDRDGDGSSYDEWWQLDASTGGIIYAPEDVTFTCVLPTEGEQPFPTAVYGHGYGSSRYEFLGFAHAFNRLGYAACAMDFPGHGPTLKEEEQILIEAVLQTRGLYSFWVHLTDARHRDLDNDGVGDSGGDQWSADAFHTRDMVRQAVLDWIWMTEGLHACGTGTMDIADTTHASCDWDGDGTPDIGGGAPISLIGGSLGGINAGVAVPILRDVEAFAPIVPGAGLLDVGMRTKIGGAVEAMFGRLTSPMIVGIPQEDGSLQVTQVVNSVTDMRELPIATLTDWNAGGRVTVENLVTGKIHEGYIPEDGRFRIAIAADALDGPEKLLVEDGSESSAYGDALVVTLANEDGGGLIELDSWETDVEHEGVTFAAGDAIVAGNTGFGHIRATPELRRLAMVFGAILEPGDPVGYARYYDETLVDGEPANVLIVPTIGDEIVPVATGIALARSAGMIERHEVDDRYGMTQDQWLVDRKVVQGLEEHGPWRNDAGEPILFDPDDLDDGLNPFDEPSDAPLRITHETEKGLMAMRLPYVDDNGTHAFAFPDPYAEFDVAGYAIFQIGGFIASGGTEIVDDPCLADATCDFIPEVP